MAAEADVRNFQQLCLAAMVLAFCAAAAADDVSAADPRPSAANTPLAAYPLDLFADTRDRPLFAPHRRSLAPPPPSVQVVAPPPPTPPPDILLLAIVSDGGVAQAVVRTDESDKAIRARLGDAIAGWTVTQIEPRRVVLSIEDRSVSFALFAGMNGKSTKSREPEPASPDVQMVTQRRTDRRIGR